MNIKKRGYSYCGNCDHGYPYVFIEEDGKTTCVTRGNMQCNTLRCSKCVNLGKYSEIHWFSCQSCDSVDYRKCRRVPKVCSANCRLKLFEKETGYYSSYAEKKKTYHNKTCDTCSTNFKVSDVSRTTCSAACRKEKTRKRYSKSSKTLKVCTVCHSEFLGHSFRKRCSPDCLAPKKPPKTCSSCDTVIGLRKTYCPEHVPSKYKKVEHIKDCETCGTTFKTNMSTRRYCKRNCRPSRKSRKRLERRKKTVHKPDWVSWGEISDFERSRPTPDHQLDHIIPLNNDVVCGLHCPSNFQWLSPDENQFKSNKFDGTTNNDSWRKKFSK